MVEADPSPSNPLRVDHASQFRTTHWSVVLEAGLASETGHAALETLCRRYWYPLYCFARRRGVAHAEAEDLTQGFFEQFLTSNWFAQLGSDKGRFRTFLLASLKHYLANEWDRANRIKRGGRLSFISMDELEPEARYALEPVAETSEEKLFDRQWARSLTSSVMDQLRKEAAQEGSEQRFEVLKVFLASEPAGEAYLTLATRLGLSVSAVKSAIHRLRRRYGQRLREAVAATVQPAEQVDEEIRHLFAALSA